MWFSLFVHWQATSSLDIQHSGARSHKDKRVTEGKGHGWRCYDSLNITLFSTVWTPQSTLQCLIHPPTLTVTHTHIHTVHTFKASGAIKDTWTHSLGEQGNKTANAQRKPSTVALSRQTVHIVIISGGPTPIHWTNGDTGGQQLLPQQHQTTLLFLKHDCESSLTLSVYLMYL